MKAVWAKNASLPSGLKSQSKRALLTPPRPPSRRGRMVSDKLSASSGMDPSAKTISVPVFHLYHKLLPGTAATPRLDQSTLSFQLSLHAAFLPGQPLPPEMTLAQLLTLLYDRKLPQGYQSINLTVKLGSKVISDPGLSKTDSFKRLRTEKGTRGCSTTLGSHCVQSPDSECDHAYQWRLQPKWQLVRDMKTVAGHHASLIRTISLLVTRLFLVQIIPLFLLYS